MAHTLLLAEPSLTIQRVVRLTFANEDIDVVVATDGAEAMALAERLRPDVVLADVSLGSCSGYEVAAFIRNHPQLSHVRVVLLSGAFERVNHGRASEVGCDLVLAKPFDPGQLLGQVKSLIGSPRMERERQDETRETPAPAVPAGPVRERAPVESGNEPVRPGAAGFLASGFIRDEAPAQTESVPPAAKGRPAAGPDDPFVFRRFAPEPAKDGPGDRPAQSWVAAEPFVAPMPPPPRTVPVTERPSPEPEATRTTGATTVEGAPPAERQAVPPPVPPRIPPLHAAPPPAPERVPSFEMLALTNKGMSLVQPPEADEEEVAAPPPPVNDVPAASGHDLGDLIPALDDYFDQLDAAFATNVEPGFRRSPDVPVPAVAAPAAPFMPPPTAAEVAPQPPASFVPEPVVPRAPAVSPFSTLRPDPPPPEAPVPAADSSPSIDDAYDALMRQLSEPKPRSSVVALRADDELLVERAVERVLARIDPAAVREAMEEVITNLAKRVIQEEIERIRRP